MPVVLNIKDPEAYALAEALAKNQGKSLTQVVKEALREKLEREQDRRGSLAQRLLDIGAGCAALPVLDPRSPDEILGFDEHGLPR